MTALSSTTPAGSAIIFKPGNTKHQSAWRSGTFYRFLKSDQENVEVQLDGDPFTVCVTSKHVLLSPSETGEVKAMQATKGPSAKELRRKAKELAIPGWDEMSLSELRAAVAAAESTPAAPAKRRGRAAAVAPEPEEADEADDDDDDEVDEADLEEAADDSDEDDDDTDLEAEDDSDEEPEPEPAPTRGRKGAAKAAPAKKAPAKAATKRAAAAVEAEVEADEALPENGNPFKVNTNMFFIAEELIKGGKRSSMVKRLSKKVALNPRSGNTDFDLEAELDRRILITGQILHNKYKFNVVRDGRGRDATIVAERP